jgi:hypothetical protein
MIRFSISWVILLLLLKASVTAQTVVTESVITPAPLATLHSAPVATTAPKTAFSAVHQKNQGDENTKEIAAMRLEYEALKQREQNVLSAMQEVTPQTTDQLLSVRARIEELEGSEPLDEWKNNSLNYFLNELETASLKGIILPEGVPQDLSLDPDVVQLADKTVLYSTPNIMQGIQLSAAEGNTPALRISNSGAMMMIWIPKNGFAFVLSQFVEVFE